MPEVPFSNESQLHAWHIGIEMANRNNIFCHCRHCSYEWMDLVTDAVCGKCGSKNIEAIACWQFPDD